jgi:hypothetical protein
MALMRVFWLHHHLVDGTIMISVHVEELTMQFRIADMQSRQLNLF